MKQISFFEWMVLNGRNLDPAEVREDGTEDGGRELTSFYYLFDLYQNSLNPALQKDKNVGDAFAGFVSSRRQARDVNNLNRITKEVRGSADMAIKYFYKELTTPKGIQE